MPRIILLNKPFRVMCQFTDPDGRATLSDYVDEPGFYAAGRLDYDSEGLLLLTDNGKLQQHIADPRFKLEKTYWVQVEGQITDEAICQLCAGVSLKDGPTRPARLKRLDNPDLWPRVPPIRERRDIPTSWLEIKLREGRNRQVRRMTAALGFPTLRLIRVAIGAWCLDDLPPGQFRTEDAPLPKQTAQPKPSQPTARKHAVSRTRQPRRHSGSRQRRSQA